MSEERFIGTRVGGDPASVHELELWLRNTLGPAVEGAAQELKDLHDDLFDIWYDWAAISFEKTLRLGKDDTFELADRIEKVAGLVDGCGTALRSTQARLDDVEAQARNQPLAVLDGQIFSPVGWPYETGAEEPVDPEFYQQQVDAFLALADMADEATRPLAEQLERTATAGIWVDVLFTAGSIVHAETSALVRHFEGNHGEVLERLGQDSGSDLADRARNLLARAGMVKRVLGPAGHVITGAEAAVSLHDGERPGRVIVELGAEAGTTVIATAVGGAVMLAGGFAVLVGAAIVATGVVLAEEVGGYVGDMYDRAVPPTPRELLLEHGDSLGYGSEGKIRW